MQLLLKPQKITVMTTTPCQSTQILITLEKKHILTQMCKPNMNLLA